MERHSMGWRIRELRESRGITIEEFAPRIGISAAHLSRIERGLHNPSFPTAARIAQELGVTARDLVTIERHHAGLDAELENVLQTLNIDEDMARHIRTRISPTARERLLLGIKGMMGTRASA